MKTYDVHISSLVDVTAIEQVAADSPDHAVKLVLERARADDSDVEWEFPNNEPEAIPELVEAFAVRCDDDGTDIDLPQASVTQLIAARSTWNKLQEAIDAWPQFDTPDHPVNGGDMVEWFSTWRAESKAIIAKPANPTPSAMNPMMIQNGRELSTILAALRYWQREGLMSSGAEHEIATNGDTLEALSTEEIDALCERINCG